MEKSTHEISYPGWEIYRLIGRGSYGTVYEIRRAVPGLTERSALKVITIPQNDSDIEALYSEGYDNPSVTAVFQSYLDDIIGEYSLMRRMNGSANIVNCEDLRYVQHDDGIGWDVYIRMELLTPLLTAAAEFAPEELAQRVGEDLCKALILCRKNSILHRDVKPQNIFLSQNGDFKLGDFGIAKVMEKTGGGTRIGTYDYMAPEVYQGQPYGQEADIYSLGLVLYWILNEHRLPFLPVSGPPTASQREAARKKRLEGVPLPPPVHGDQGLRQAVLKACAYDPADRFPSAQALGEALIALEPGAVSAPEVPVPEPEPVREAEETATVGLFSHRQAPASGEAEHTASRPRSGAAERPWTPPPGPVPPPPVWVPQQPPAAPAQRQKDKRVHWKSIAVPLALSVPALAALAFGIAMLVIYPSAVLELGAGGDVFLCCLLSSAIGYFPSALFLLKKTDLKNRRV